MGTFRLARPRPLVVGLPRTGFKLLISIITELQLLNPVPPDVYQIRLSALAETLGQCFGLAVDRVFEQAGKREQLLLNENFRELTGGPVWNHDARGTRAYFRKYIGVEPEGDFTLITSLPLGVLLRYPVVYSHGPASGWLNDVDLPIGPRFASVRSPAGTLNSACFSVNALASEYITRNYSDVDPETLRYGLAAYKLSSLEFFNALVQPLKRGLEDLLANRSSFTIIAWEDVIAKPEHTILHVAEALGVPATPQQATQLWAKISHRNLTGAHRHNYRVGKAYVGDERDTLTNEHIDYLRETGVTALAEEFGYPAPPHFRESGYNDFQRRVSAAWKSGETLNECCDSFLFECAFNKSNLDFACFGYRQHPWDKFVRVERSSLPTDSLERNVSAAVDPLMDVLSAAVDLIIDTASNDGESVSREVSQTMPRGARAVSSDDLERLAHMLAGRLRSE